MLKKKIVEFEKEMKVKATMEKELKATNKDLEAKTKQCNSTKAELEEKKKQIESMIKEIETKSKEHQALECSKSEVCELFLWLILQTEKDLHNQLKESKTECKALESQNLKLRKG